MPRFAIRDGWTPGQSALLRAGAGLYLAAAMLLAAPLSPWSAAGAALALLHVSGWREAPVAALLAVPLAWFGSLPFDPFALALALALALRAFGAPIGMLWLLLGAAFAAAAAAGALLGERRELVALHAVLSVLAFALGPRAATWLAMLAAETALAAAGRVVELEWSAVALLFCSLDPAWIRPRAHALPMTVYYDGTCGFCHRGVKFLLGEDPDGRALRYAPLQGASFARLVPEPQRAGLPDSIVVRDPDGTLHVRSAAALRIGAALGGLWRPLAALARLVPRPLRDAVYDGVARIRGRLFRKPDDLCPLLPPQWRNRFDAD